jgi:hypothetical protein
MFKHRKKIEEHEHIELDKIFENISVSVVDEEDVLREKVNEQKMQTQLSTT